MEACSYKSIKPTKVIHVLTGNQLSPKSRGWGRMLQKEKRNKWKEDTELGDMILSHMGGYSGMVVRIKTT